MCASREFIGAFGPRIACDWQPLLLSGSGTQTKRVTNDTRRA